MPAVVIQRIEIRRYPLGMQPPCQQMITQYDGYRGESMRDCGHRADFLVTHETWRNGVRRATRRSTCNDHTAKRYREWSNESVGLTREGKRRAEPV